MERLTPARLLRVIVRIVKKAPPPPETRYKATREPADDRLRL